jgi:hypothetical protein
MSRALLPLSEMIVVVLSDGLTRKRRAISSLLEDRFSPDQIEGALRKLQRDGRVIRVRSGYYALVSPFEQGLDTEASLNDPAFEIIRRYARAPATFEMIARSRFVPRSSLWRCISALAQRGELSILAGQINEGGLRFQTNLKGVAEPTERQALDLSEALNSGGIFRMSELERATRLTSRMLLNRLKDALGQGLICSFQFRGRRYVVGSPFTIETLNIRLQGQPQAIIGAAEFGSSIVELLCKLRRIAAEGHGALANAEFVPALVRAGLVEARKTDTAEIELTGCGLLVAGGLARAATHEL